MGHSDLTELANAYADAMNCIGVVALPRSLAAVRQAEFEAGLRHSLRTLLSVLEEAGHQFLGELNTPRVAFLVEQMIETLEREGLTSGRLSSQARSVIETAGLLPPEGWAALEAHVESLLSKKSPDKDPT